jgi:hypothetical protein
MLSSLHSPFVARSHGRRRPQARPREAREPRPGGQTATYLEAEALGGWRSNAAPMRRQSRPEWLR